MYLPQLQVSWDEAPDGVQPVNHLAEQLVIARYVVIRAESTQSWYADGQTDGARSGLSAPSLDDTSIGGSGRESFEFAVIKSRRSALAPEMFSVK